MIAVTQARIILGAKYAHLTDNEIERMVVFIYNLCKDIIHTVVRNEHEKSNNILSS